MTVYAVFKVGIYRHECAGLFASLDEAKRVADEYLALGDGHHTWEVVSFELDVATPANRSAKYVRDRDELTESAAVYVAKKPKDRLGMRAVSKPSAFTPAKPSDPKENP